MIRGPIHTVGEFPRNVWRPGTRCGKRLGQRSRVVRVNGKRVTIARERPGENFAVAHPTYKRRASFLENLRFFLPHHTQTTSRLRPEPLLCRQYAHRANALLSSGFLTVTVASELTHRASQPPTIDKQDIMSDAQESSDTSAPVSEISSREHALLVAALSSLKSGRSLSCCSIFDDC